MDDDDLPPPLEDMTASLDLRKKLNSVKAKNQTSFKPATKPAKKAEPTSTAKPLNAGKTQPRASTMIKASESPTTTVAKKSGGGFGGFNKGFLTSPKKKSTTTTRKAPASKSTSDVVAKSAPRSSKPDDDIPFIRPQKAKRGNVIDEVQDAMKDAAPFLEKNKDQWMTPEFLQKMAQIPGAEIILKEPGLLQMFQTNPGAAMKKYQNRPEVLQFFQAFCKIMGEHLIAMDPKANQEQQQPAPTPLAKDDQAKVDEWLKDGDVMDAFQDQRVQRLIQTLRENPDKADELQRQLHTASPTLRRRIRVLCDRGILGIARNVMSPS